MEIPKYYEIMPFALNYLDRQGVAHYRSLESPVGELMGLDVEQLALEYESGNGKIFLDRLSWALSHLSMAGLVDKPKLAHYAISEQGKAFVGKANELQAFIKEFRKKKRLARKKEKQNSANNVEDSGTTPLELIEESAAAIKEKVCDEIISTILKKSPYEFEKLVLELMGKMGYGGKVEDALTVTQKSGDGGIDGIIKEDVLGLGKVHLQAKRYAEDKPVGEKHIRDFVGSLAGVQSSKGVFITTSSYTSSAREYAKNLANITVVLIDGDQLAQYIYDFGLGMQTEQLVEIKGLDSDFWDQMLDAK